MLKLEIRIKEIESLDTKDFCVIRTKITIREIGRKATKYEKEFANILKKRLKVDEKIQNEINEEELKEQLEKLLKSL